MTDFLLFSLFCFLAVCWAIGTILYYRFLSRLRSHHRDVWRELGSPTMVANNSAQNYFAVRRFLKQRRFIGLDDAELESRACALWRYGNYCLVAVGVILVAMLMLILRSDLGTTTK
ncbi:MAG TPA: hypothetical protein VFA95_08205 [Gammaproteobacteria bacterium]|nr:hypothetical protein [Gammaproteobacteria bacterium]